MRALVCSLIVAVAAAAPSVCAQVYKWTDDKGVVNYSNTPPEGKSKKGVSVVEDRVSVYTADPAVVQATQNARERRGLVPPPTAAVDQRPPPPAPAQLPVPPVSAVDPCLNGYDPINCPHYGGVYPGRHRPPRLIQPNLAPGATAGNVHNGTGYTPGLSTQAGLGAQPPARPQRQQTAPLRDR